MTLRLLDTFSGIGGFSLAARWLGGFETVQFVERDRYCQRILRKHWPDVPIHDDICTFNPAPGTADVVVGGFPCQDISQAGKGAGLAGERSGLFYELLRVVRLVGPRYVVLENVAAILSRGLDDVLGALAEAGYDCEWACIPASAVGACHHRDRWWCVAYTSSADGSRGAQGIGRWQGGEGDAGGSGIPEGSRITDATADTQGGRRGTRSGQGQSQAGHEGPGGGDGAAGFAADATGEQRDDLRGQRSGRQAEPEPGDGDGAAAADTSSLRGQRRGAPINVASTARAGEVDSQQRQWNGNAVNDCGATPDPMRQRLQGPYQLASRRPQWPAAPKRLSPNWGGYVSQPVLRRGDDGLSGRVDRLKALGNAVVPQVAMVPLARVLELERQLNGNHW